MRPLMFLQMISTRFRWGHFPCADNAERVRMQYAQRFGTAQLAVKQGAVPLWRVLIGKEPSISSCAGIGECVERGKPDRLIVCLVSGRRPPAKSPAPATAPGLIPANDKVGAEPLPESFRCQLTLIHKRQ